MIIWGRYKAIVIRSKLNPKLPIVLEKSSKLKRYVKTIKAKQILTKSSTYRLRGGLKNITVVIIESKKGRSNLSEVPNANPYSKI